MFGRVEWKCIACPFIYKPPIGMGIYRIPINCPECGGKIKGYKIYE